MAQGDVQATKCLQHPPAHASRTLRRQDSTKDNNEWVQGYGYQMWICRHGAARADGYAGQYFFVFPDRDAVLVLTTSSSLYQPYIDLIWEYLLPVL